ncbi:hypothetical protein AB8B02_18995 [Tardiphaga sp. 862_B3_N4_1]|uniref:hypothetical protein n=1 Tax=Tardiphaga sp. 862_B3_N4_1 TaxID=3240764 RepID=UPI003F226475
MNFDSQIAQLLLRNECDKPDVLYLFLYIVGVLFTGVLRPELMEGHMAPEEKNTAATGETERCHDFSPVRQYYGSIHDRDQLARAILQGGSWADPEIADLTARAATSPSVEGQLLNSFINDDDQAEEVACGGHLKVDLETPSPATRPSNNPFGSAPTASPIATQHRTRPNGVVNPFVKDRAQAPEADRSRATGVQINASPFFHAT